MDDDTGLRMTLTTERQGKEPVSTTMVVHWAAVKAINYEDLACELAKEHVRDLRRC